MGSFTFSKSFIDEAVKSYVKAEIVIDKHFNGTISIYELELSLLSIIDDNPNNNDKEHFKSYISKRFNEFRNGKTIFYNSDRLLELFDVTMIDEPCLVTNPQEEYQQLLDYAWNLTINRHSVFSELYKQLS